MKKIKFSKDDHERPFSCKIEGKKLTGKISIDENGDVFFCHNNKHFDGAEAENKLGYRYSRTLDKGTCSDFKIQEITKFKFLDLDPKTYMDWQVGDKLVRNTNMYIKTGIVIFRKKSMVVFEYINNMGKKSISGNYSCIDLFDAGWRLDVKKPKEIKEVTMDEIAKCMKIPVDQLKIKKE